MRPWPQRGSGVEQSPVGSLLHVSAVSADVRRRPSVHGATHATYCLIFNKKMLCVVLLQVGQTNVHHL